MILVLIIIALFLIGMFIDIPEPKCTVCEDRGVIYENVMGTDFDYVECPFCSEKEQYKEFQERYKI